MRHKRIHEHVHKVVEFGVAADLVVRALHEPHAGVWIVAVPVVVYVVVVNVVRHRRRGAHHGTSGNASRRGRKARARGSR